jgi:diaminohydroxyphosphoribosylaminopyrimidine deaminase/5-amino-6-(5-phosphoribosylamino)uracil reductase
VKGGAGAPRETDAGAARALAAADARFLALALRLGLRGKGATWPNPSVGCVLVREGRIVARAATTPGGRPHAETRALAAAGAAARGATAYVSLEPCAHHGVTPPCAVALAEAGVARVVTALSDPDPRTAGQGHAALRAAGLEVVPDAAAEAGRAAHRGFLSRVERGRPFLVLKLATSADGRIATATGESRWITGAEARRQVHLMRALADAVLVGAGTARADDPLLTARGLGPVAQPVRVVASRHLDLPEAGRLAASAGGVAATEAGGRGGGAGGAGAASPAGVAAGGPRPGGAEPAGPLWLCHGADAPADRVARWAARGAEPVPVPLGPGRQIDPAGLLAALAARGVGEVLCEGGGALAASLLAAGLVDELVTFTAGLALGAEGQPGLGALGIDALAEAPRFRLAALRPVGADVMAVWHPAPLPGGARV